MLLKFILCINYLVMIFKNYHSLLLTAIIAGIMLSGTPISGFAQKAKPVYEIAVRMVKKGKKIDFVDQRSKFIKLLKKQEGVSNNREFQSFYALPQPDKREVFIGLTRYNSLETVGNVSRKVMPRFMQFAQTMDLKAYVFVMLIAGKKFKLNKLAAKKGQVLEVAIRRVKKGQNKAFQETRKAFVNYLSKQKGVLGSWEFAVVGGKDRERLTVGMSVYKNKEVFMKIVKQVQSNPLAGKYFSTFDPVALQYAVSTTND
ncbi:hypothetical protein BKI52_44570 [marine bacterium AO1-C]|nr:hypothetical protein BKI52_44570 [marine bacterium AO1-C]